MSRTSDLTADVDIDVTGLIAEVWKKRWLVMALTLLTGAAVLAVTLNIDPRYDATARILVERRESVFTRPSSAGTAQEEARFDEQAIGSQVQILTSDDIALQVIKTLGLDRTEEFGTPGSGLGDILALFGLKGQTSEVTAAERSLAKFREHLTVYAADRSRVLVVEFWSRDPEIAQAVPNAVADEYLKLIKQAKIDSNAEATQWLGPEIDDLRAKVRAAEARVAEFKANSDILDGTNNSLLATQQLSEVSSQVSQLRVQRAAAEAKATSIRNALQSGASLDTIPEVLASPLIQRLRERQVSLQAEISELSTTLLPNHPRLKALRSQLSDFERQIRTEANNILKGLQNNAEVLRDQENELVSDLDRLKAEAARAGEAEVELRALEREAAAQRDLLETYLTQYREATSRQSREYLPVDARIISRAVRPIEPYFPKTIPMIATGMITMFILVVVAILAWALMSGRAFKTTGMPVADAMPERLEVPEPAMVAEPDPVPPAIVADAPVAEQEAEPEPEPVPSPEPSVVFEKQGSSVAEFDDERNLPEVNAPSIETVRAEADNGDEAVPLSSDSFGPEIFPFALACEAIENLGSARIAVVSPAGDPGSIAARLLARRLAEHGKSAAIIDLTGSGVTTRAIFGNGSVAGLRELLAGTVRFGDAVRRDPLTSAHVLPAGGDAQGGDPSRLADIIEIVDDTYDFRIYDCGYTGAEALKLVADEETVVLVSDEEASEEETSGMIGELAGAGFAETILVHLDEADRNAELAGAA